VLWAILGLCVH